MMRSVVRYKDIHDNLKSEAWHILISASWLSQLHVCQARITMSSQVSIWDKCASTVFFKLNTIKLNTNSLMQKWKRGVPHTSHQSKWQVLIKLMRRCNISVSQKPLSLSLSLYMCIYTHTHTHTHIYTYILVLLRYIYYIYILVLSIKDSHDLRS